MLVEDAFTETDGVTTEFTVMATGVEETDEGEAHAAVDVITQVISSPSLRAALL